MPEAAATTPDLTVFCRRCGHPSEKLRDLVQQHRELAMLPPETELFRLACVRGDSVVAENILKNQPHLVHQKFTVLGWRPLHYAAMGGHKKLAGMLLRHGAIAEIPNAVQETAFDIACRNEPGGGGVAGVLLAHRACRQEVCDAGPTGPAGENAAVSPIFSLQEKSGPEPEPAAAPAPPDSAGSPACSTNHAPIFVDTLQAAGVNKVKVKNESLRNLVALHAACKRDDVTAVQTMLDEQNAYIDARTNSGWTPLMQACANKAGVWPCS